MKLADNLSRYKISRVQNLVRVDYLLGGYLPGLLKRPYLTWACWTQVTDRCPLGDLLDMFVMTIQCECVSCK